MNQILSVEMPNNKRKKGNKKASIKSVVIFFCIMLFIFGMSIISVGIFMQIQNGQVDTKKANIEEKENKPKIEIIQDVSTLNITVSSESEISKIIYKWNNEEETQVNGNNEKDLTLNIDIPLGNNILSITAIDINGKEQSFEKTYTGVEQYKPTIELGQEANTIKIRCDSNSTIDYISYSFDDEEMQTVRVEDISAEIPINAIEGEHTLAIEVVNQEGGKYTDKKSIYIPIATIVTDGENFIINAEDTRGITKVKINFNGEENEVEVSDTKYTNSIKLQEGENRISLVVYNSDGLSITKRVKYQK